jgi:hypothetical protein
VNAVHGYLPATGAAFGLARVRIHIEARIVAARDIEAHAMSALEQI